MAQNIGNIIGIKIGTCWICLRSNQTLLQHIYIAGGTNIGYGFEVTASHSTGELKGETIRTKPGVVIIYFISFR